MNEAFEIGGDLGPAASLPLNELVFRILQDHIVRDVFSEGLILRQGSIADSFGVGRDPAAKALRKLEGKGLIRKRIGHGFLVANGDREVEPVEMGLESAGLVLPKVFRDAVTHRKLKAIIYPKVERAVASLLVFGRFRINQSALAEHFGVSRTIAHEILIGLEGVGLARPGSNTRWYAGPLTYERIEECYEIRWLLEPVALRQAASSIAAEELHRVRDHLNSVLERGRFEPDEMSRIEAELHSDLVLRCTNQQMRQVLIRCQLPIIATFDTVQRIPGLFDHGSGLHEAVEDHGVVLDHLLNRDVDGAASALELHLHRAFELCAPHFKDLPALARDKIPPYMTLES